MTEQRFGIFGKDVTRYIPPELRPFTKLAVDMNPVTGFQRAGRALKEGDYTGSAVETGILALPAGAYALRNVIKPSVTAGVDALKELFLLGAADDVVKKAPVKEGVSRRDVLAGMGATVLVPPVLKEAGEVLPAAKVGKVAKTVLKGGPLAQARALDSDISRIFVNSIRPNRNITKPVRAAELKEQDIKTIEMNKILHNFMKDKSYDNLMKMDKQDLIELFNIKYKTHHTVSDGVDDAAYRIKFGASAGDPLRSERNGPLLDRVFKDRGLDPPTYGVPKNYEGPPPLGYRPEAYPNIKQKPRGEYEYDFLSVDTTQGLKDLNLDIPSSIIPKMFPSGTTAKTTSLFPNEAKKGRQLLIVSCGSTKCPDVGNMKALDRYLGPIFQSIKKAGVPENVDVAILSAKHGLIRADTPIENYDQLMTKDKVKDFVNNPNEMSKIAETMQGYDNVLVQGGDNYKNVIKSAAGDIPFTEVPKGRGIGDQRSSVAKFLTEAAGGGSTTTKQDIDTLFEAMDEEGALLEFPELGKKLNRYTFNNDRDALIEAITDEDYPAYEAAMKGMLKRTFPSGKIPVRRVENYTELQLFGTKDPETLAMMEQAGLQKLKDQKKVVTEKLIDIDDVKFVGNPAEEELIILDTPRQFRKGAMIGDKQLLSYTINLPKKVEKKAEGGIAGLSDVARDMFKGPKGIGAYQPFMVG